MIPLRLRDFIGDGELTYVFALIKGHVADKRAPTVAEFLRSWLSTSVKPNVRPLTYAGYKVNVDKHLVPTLGKIRLDQLTPRHVQEMTNNAGTLRVRNQLQRIEGRPMLVPPKTERSRRTLVMPSLIVERLRGHDKRQGAEKLWAGSKWQETGLVFANKNGGPTEARHVIDQFHQRWSGRACGACDFTIFATPAQHCSSFRAFHHEL